MAYTGQWWQHGVVYQVYPRSFMDSNGDGVGDLPGLTSRLDHLVWLGVDAVWLSPFYPSPMADFGYDVSDHKGVDPSFGTMRDFDEMLGRAHQLGLKVILDFVPNHTSNQHPWFLESRSSRSSPKRSWYVWRDPSGDGGPPNNWLSVFGGPGWTWDERTGQYYYHSYLREQPDLNWRNPEVCEAMHDVLRFWLDKGVDGFRVDALRKVMKDPLLRDNPPNPAWKPKQGPYRSLLATYTAGLPEVHDVVAAMRAVLDEYQGRVMIGELYEPLEKLVEYYGQGGTECHLPFNFQLISTPWDAAEIAALVARYEGLLPPGGWPNWVLGNHDKPRLASRVGQQHARTAAMLLLTLRGTPTLYQGDELGMCDVPIAPELVQDPWEKNVPGLGLGRDPARTPLQWTAGAHAGFSTAAPWLPLEPEYRERCVERLAQDPSSIQTLYRDLLRLRRAEPALSHGSIGQVRAQGPVLFYERERDGRRLRIALNLGREPQRVVFDPAGRILLSTTPERAPGTGASAIELAPAEGVIVDGPR